MARYLFHCIGPEREFIDEVGLDLPNLHAARATALELARVLSSEEEPDGWRGWIVEVSDEYGSTVFTTRLAAALCYH